VADAVAEIEQAGGSGGPYRKSAASLAEVKVATTLRRAPTTMWVRPAEPLTISASQGSKSGGMESAEVVMHTN
jgi:hypothetical protein